MFGVLCGSTTRVLLVSIDGWSDGVPGTEEEPERGHDADDGLVPPRDLQGSPEVERLLAHLASARVPSVCPPWTRMGPMIWRARMRPVSAPPPSPENVSLVLRSSPGLGRPRPTQRKRRDSPSQAVGVPAEDGVGLTAVQAPPQLRRKLESRGAGRRSARPAQDRERLVELGLDIGAAVEGQAQVVTAALDLVLDLDAPLGPVEPDRPAMVARADRGTCSHRARPSSWPSRRSSVTSISVARACRTHRKGPPSVDWFRPASSTVLCAIVERKYDRHAGRRGSSRCPDRRGCRRRRTGPRPTARRRGRARRC